VSGGSSAYAPSGDVPVRERSRLLSLLRRWGWNSTSFQTLEPGFEYWFEQDPSGEDLACVAYLDTGSAFVVAGSPIADPEHLPDVAGAFVAWAGKRGRRVSFFGVEQGFLDRVDLRSFELGRQPFWDAGHWPEIVASRRSLREQLRRARAKGVRVEAMPAEAVGDEKGEIRRDVGRLIGRWLASRPMPPMAFLVELEPFAFAEERRYWVARRGGEMVGLLVAVPIFRRRGWLFEDLLRDPAAPNGTAELLIDAAMRDVGEGPSRWVTLGLAPLAGDARWQRVVRRLMKGFYNFEGVRDFKAKLRPDGWDPIHLAWPHRGVGIGALYDGLAAFAHGRPFAFGLRAISRMPPVVLRGFALVLAAWTIAVALAEPLHWFPSAAVHAAWVTFDCAMALVLLRLARRWTRGLGVTAALAMTLDAVGSIVQLTTFNLFRGPIALEWLAIAAGVIGPVTAALMLWVRVRMGDCCESG